MSNLATPTNIFMNKPLQNDNVFVENSVVSMSKLCGIPTRKGYENAIISGGELVNVVSDGYGHLPNENFFLKVEEKLIDEDIQYATRSINRNNRSFAVDYILKDPNFHVNIKNGKDLLVPMLRFTSSYDGSAKTSGHLGFFRKVCDNGLHVAHSNVAFAVKRRGDIAEIVIPEITALVRSFMDNEFYSLHRKFEVMAETPLTDLKGFVKFMADRTKLFTYESSEKNPAPSLNARLILETIQNESQQIGMAPNLWLGYNAFNELLHGKLKKTFEQQKSIDSNIFESVLEMANAN